MGSGANARRGGRSRCLALLLTTALVGCWTPSCTALETQELLSLQVSDWLCARWVTECQTFVLLTLNDVQVPSVVLQKVAFAATIHLDELKNGTC